MDILRKINRILKLVSESDEDEYDSLRDQFHAAVKAGKKTMADLLRKKMSELRIRMVTHHD